MRLSAGLCFVALLLTSPHAEATSLRAAPAKLELVAPDSAATLSLRNEDSKPINAQIRVFRWSQVNGEEKLEPNVDVAASPPLTTLGGGIDYVVRVVRVTKTPVAGEETYRLLVDELPDAARRVPGAVTVVVRYSIPVFFVSRDAAPPKLSWAIKQVDGSLVLTGTNSGGRHARISDLQLTSEGKPVVSRAGLVGYVLGGSTMQWTLPLPRSGPAAPRALALSAQTESGPIHATIAVSPGR